MVTIAGIANFLNQNDLSPEIRRLGLAAIQFNLVSLSETVQCAVKAESEIEFIQLLANGNEEFESFLIQLNDLFLRTGISAADCLTKFINDSETESSGDSTHRTVGETINETSIDSVSTATGNGDERFGHFILVREVAKGGMGVVYDAIDKKLNRRVALKLILGGNLADEMQRKRFFAEAESAAKLKHGNIVQVYDVGSIEDQDYMALAFVDGPTLYDVANEKRMPPRRAAELMCEIADAMQYAHNQGVVHRDLKPQNVLLDGKQIPKVTDFGLARNTSADSNLTTAGQVIGTPSYMPPEQAAGNVAEIDAVSDVYSLGATLYFLLTGCPPFQSENAIQTMAQVLNSEPLSIRKQNRSVPKTLETICLKCLRKEKGHRYQTATELREDLTRWLNNEPILAKRTTRVEKSLLWLQRNPVYPIAGVLILLAALVGWRVFAGQTEVVEQAKLIDRLATADISRLESILDEVNVEDESFFAQLPVRLKTAIDDQNKSQELRYRLALLRKDKEQRHQIEHFVFSCSLEELGVIVRSLSKHGSVNAEDYWRIVKHRFHSEEKRTRALALLAEVDRDSVDWKDWRLTGCIRTAAEHIVQQPASEAAQWLALYLPVQGMLDEAFLDVYRNFECQIGVNTRGANDYGIPYDLICNDAEKLIILQAEDKYLAQFELFANSRDGNIKKYFDILRNDKPKFENLCLDVISEAPVPCHDRPYDYQSIRKANCHLALFQLGHESQFWQAMKFTPDPTVRSHLINLCMQHRQDPGFLFDRLKLETDNSVIRGILLALSTYRYDVFENEKRAEAQIVFIDLYKNNPDAGVHGAAGFILGAWYSFNDIPQIDKQIIDEQLGVTNPADGQWTISPLGITQVAVGPGEYLMGRNPDDFGFHYNCIEKHRRIIPRKILVATNPVIFKEYRAFAKEKKIETFQDYRPDGNPAFCDFYDAAHYCNWLSAREGIPEDQWCYAPDENGKYASGMKTTPNFLERTGYRLPTEAEWEFFCRAGTTTKYYFGECYSLWRDYMVIADGKGFHYARPNELGLFDLTGWKFEWCNESQDPSQEVVKFASGCVDQVEPLQFMDDQFAVVTGENVANYSMTSAQRNTVHQRLREVKRKCEWNRNPGSNGIGFRVIRTIEPQSSFRTRFGGANE